MKPRHIWDKVWTYTHVGKKTGGLTLRGRTLLAFVRFDGPFLSGYDRNMNETWRNYRVSKSSCAF